MKYTDELDAQGLLNSYLCVIFKVFHISRESETAMALV